MKSRENRSFRIVIVGDEKVGKTCLALSYRMGRFPEDYVPRVTAAVGETITCDGVQVGLCLFDTYGKEDYDTLRPLCYTKKDVFLLCFSVDNWSSFNNIATKWQLEIRHHCPKSIYILVATKTDLRNSMDCNNPVPKTQGEEMAAIIKAAKYVECSAKTMESVQEVFEETARSALNHIASLKNRKQKKCILL